MSRALEPLQAKRLVTIETPVGTGPIGSIKWRTERHMDRCDKEALATARAVVPGAQDAQLFGVCPAPVDAAAGFDGALDAGDIVQAFA